ALRQRRQYARAIPVQLGLTDARNLRQALKVARLGDGDLQQGPVLEDHIGRHALLGGALAPPGPERLEAGPDLGVHVFQRRIAALAAARTLARIAGACGGVEAWRGPAHLDGALAAVDRPHRRRIAQSDQGFALVRILDQQALEHQVVDDVAPAVRRQVAPHAPGRQALLPRLDVPGLAQQVVDDPAAAETLVQPLHRRQRLLRRRCGVVQLGRVLADVADAAGLRLRFAEIAAHRLRPADGAVQHGEQLARLPDLHRLDLVGHGAAVQTAQGP